MGIHMGQSWDISWKEQIGPLGSINHGGQIGYILTKMSNYIWFLTARLVSLLGVNGEILRFIVDTRDHCVFSGKYVDIIALLL